MTELMLPQDLVYFLKKEIRKEIMKNINGSQSLDSTCDRIFQLINLGASKVIIAPRQKKIIHTQLN